MDESAGIGFLKRLAKGMAEQFGQDCEVVIHDLSQKELTSTIAVIENGHVSGRSLGDCPSQVVLEAMRGGQAEDRLSYYTKTKDGRVLRSSTIFVRDDKGAPSAVVSINYDVSKLMVADHAIRALLSGLAGARAAPSIPLSVGDLLDQLIGQSVELIGKPPALMSKEEKARAIRYLNDAGAFLITRSGDKISKFFGISKFTMYSYFDAKEGKADAPD